MNIVSNVNQSQRTRLGCGHSITAAKDSLRFNIKLIRAPRQRLMWVLCDDPCGCGSISAITRFVCVIVERYLYLYRFYIDNSNVRERVKFNVSPGSISAIGNEIRVKSYKFLWNNFIGIESKAEMWSRPRSALESRGGSVSESKARPRS
ncbi:hypothetical protein EVAR_66223_1 [Eumeta japonica]|uniref:Uncharacterized protein n=1 Tax=Eumeta variegata TaxID=151549 RepID=A0A4C2ACX2_EUMVA|nr:hypothetical protein EVAR_66223_1 [Eumeta japonica]